MAISLIDTDGYDAGSAAQSLTGFDAGTGSERILVVGQHRRGGLVSHDYMSAPDFAGQDLTLLEGGDATIYEFASGSNYRESLNLYYLFNTTTTGTGTITGGIDFGNPRHLLASSYDGVDSTTGIEDSTHSTSDSATTPYSASVTVTTDDSWLVGIAGGLFGSGMALTGGTGTTNRTISNAGNVDAGIFDSGGTVASGSRSLEVTGCTSTGFLGLAVMTIAPVAGGGGPTQNSNFLAFF